MDKNYLEKKDACVKSIHLVPQKGAVGLGSGSTIDLFASIINETNESKFSCVSKTAKQRLTKRKLAVENTHNLNIAFDGADEIIKQKGKLIALKGKGGMDFTKEKEQDYSAKKLVLLIGESKLKNKKREIMLEINKKNVKNALKELNLIGVKA